MLSLVAYGTVDRLGLGYMGSNLVRAIGATIPTRTGRWVNLCIWWSHLLYCGSIGIFFGFSRLMWYDMYNNYHICTSRVKPIIIDTPVLEHTAQHPPNCALPADHGKLTICLQQVKRFLTRLHRFFFPNRPINPGTNFPVDNIPNLLHEADLAVPVLDEVWDYIIWEYLPLPNQLAYLCLGW